MSWLKEMQNSWPPHDPSTDHQFTLPASPWTYENNSLNPNLRPNNTLSRRLPVSSVPPYHPDYNHGSYISPHHTEFESDLHTEDAHESRSFVRRGSEGYEVRPIDRGEMLRRLLEEQGMEPGKYNVYMPEPYSDTSSEDIPLGEVKLQCERMI